MKGEGSHLTKKIDFRNPGEGFILKFFKWENPGEENKGEGFSNYYTGMRPYRNIIPLALGGHLEFLLLRLTVFLFLSLPPPFIS